MGYLSFKTPPVHRSILGITLLVSSLVTCFPAWIADHGIALITVLIVLFGIPHGAADCLIFKYSARKGSTESRQFNFYTIYIALVVGDIICWYLFPALALSIFIAISIYHLGQSNLGYLALPHRYLIRSFAYCCWGAFVVFVPILADPESVTAILAGMIGQTGLTSLPHPASLIVVILALNLLILGRLAQLRYISQSSLWREAAKLLILTVLFVSAPLVISFGVYFTLWHSLGSTLDQIRLIRQTNPTFDLMTFYGQTAPLTLLSIALFVLAGWLFTDRLNLYYGSLSAVISLFFIGLSAITLPHAVIRDSLYRNI